MFPEISSRLSGLFASSPPLSIFGESGVPGEQKTAASFEAITTDWYARNGYEQIYAALGGGSAAWSGERVNLASALNHSVVWACNRIISETVGFIPLVMMRASVDPSKGKQLALKHPMYQALMNAPNEDMTAMGFRETLTSHTVLQGNAYARIIRRSGTGVAVELHPLQPSQVRNGRNKAGELVYVVKQGNEQEKTYTVQKNKPQDLFHMRGLGNNGTTGFSVISMAFQSIGTAISAEKNLGNFFARGGRLPYILEMAQRFKTKEDFDRFRADWEMVYAIAHKAPILENDIKYKQIGVSLKDSQLLETRLFSIHEICRWFGVPPHLVGDLSRATFSNIEQLALEFVKLTLSAWLTRWEQELWRCVLTPEEKGQNYLWRHNLNSLLRGDFTSRMAGYATMLQNGIANQDEIRDLEDWNPIENGIGTGYHIQLNMQTLPPDGGPLQPPKSSPGDLAGNPKTPGDPKPTEDAVGNDVVA
jgi:HK97 family phage portal protein